MKHLKTQNYTTVHTSKKNDRDTTKKHNNKVTVIFTLFWQFGEISFDTAVTEILYRQHKKQQH